MIPIVLRIWQAAPHEISLMTKLPSHRLTQSSSSRADVDTPSSIYH